MLTAAAAVPRPRLREVLNLTPFAHFDCDKMAPGRAFFDTVVVKGTYRLTPGVLEPADVQSRIVLADEPFDEDDATRSSLRRAGEVVLFKPATDVLVTGTARVAKASRGWSVAIALKGERKQQNVFGQDAETDAVLRERYEDTQRFLQGVLVNAQGPIAGGPGATGLVTHAPTETTTQLIEIGNGILEASAQHIEIGEKLETAQEGFEATQRH